MQLADEQGRFSVQIRSGAGVIEVRKVGYLTAIIPLAEPFADPLNVSLTRGAAITGRVTDSTGRSVVAVTVGLRRETASDNDGEVIKAGIAVTDDRGRYRFANLPAGRYTIGVLALNAPYTHSKAALAELQDRVRHDATALPPFSSGADITLSAGEEAGAGDIVVAADPRCARRAIDRSNRDELHGHVYNSAGQPLSCVAITIRGQSGASTQATSGLGGEFVFEAPTPSYDISAEISGYITTRIERHAQNADRLAATQRTQPDDITVVMAKLGVVSGIISDEFGDPVEAAQLSALQIREVDGRKVAVLGAPPGQAYSDDRGEYRLFGLPAGDYIIQSDPLPTGEATVSNARTYVNAFYPSTPAISSASSVAVDVGSESTNINISHEPVLTRRVKGTALDARGVPINGSVWLIVSEQSGLVATVPKRLSTQADGTFEFSGVVPGDYVIQVMGARTFGAQRITVGESQPPAVSIIAYQGATLQGTMSIDTGADVSPLPAVLSLPTVSDYSPIGSIGPAQSVTMTPSQPFRLSDLFGPQRLFLLTAGMTYLKSVWIDGRDVVDVPIELPAGKSIADAEIVVGVAGSVSGRLVDDRERSVSGGFVVAFPTDTTKWFRYSRFVRVTRSSDEGWFRVDGLPPGEYWLSASAAAMKSADINQATLNSLARDATVVRMAEGEQRGGVILRTR